ncbi:MAG: amidohydrolase family protein, partial [Nitrospinaceae bacterium]|nr:amidohydrolase family protein [Nitrospinaceae bacterium]
IHLDKAYLEERRPNLSGTLADAIAITLELKKNVSKQDIRERSERALRQCVRHGSTRFRIQVEVDPIVGLKGMEAALELKESCAALADIQTVIFPQEGIEQQPGTEELMREAMRMGGDVVGGVPYNDVDPERHLDIVFGLAEEFGAGVDFHLDFSDDPADCAIESVARRTVDAGLKGRVAVGHLTSLGAMEDSRAARVIEKIAEADINVLPLPATDLFLNGRGDMPPRYRSLTRVKELIAAGVNVSAASNNIRNAFTPSGRGDLLEIGLLLAHVAHMTGAAERVGVPDLFTHNAARAMGIEDSYGIAPGRPADFVVLDSLEWGDIIIDQPEKRYVVKRGKVVVENCRESVWRG